MSSDAALSQLIADNVATLQAAVDLVAGIDRADYAPIGAHLRHLLDHYDRLLTPVDGDTVDYDARERCQQTEQSPAVALRRLQVVIRQLQELAAVGDAPLRVVMTTDPDQPPAMAGSTRARELQFLQSHCVHHFALMRRALLDAGVAVDEHFGKAPATIGHERSPVPERQRASA